MSLSHESYPSTPDHNEFQRRVSIDAFSKSNKKSRQSTTVHYKGLAISNSWIADPSDRLRVKAIFLNCSRNNKETRLFAEQMLCLNKILQEKAAMFNNAMRYQIEARCESSIVEFEENKTVSFQSLQMASLSSRSFFDKSRRENEWFVFCDKLSKSEMFLDSEMGAVRTGRMRSSRSFCECESESTSERSRSSSRSSKMRTRAMSLSSADATEESSDCSEFHPHWYLHAFVHHFFSYMGGRMAVDCLRGSHNNEDGYTLITPVIHSMVDYQKMPGNCGKAGMERVIENHRCNAYCKHLPNMKELMDDAIVQERLSHESNSFSKSRERQIGGHVVFV